MLSLVIIIIILVTVLIMFNSVSHWARIQYATLTLERLLSAYGRGDISKVQFSVMIKEMADPHDIQAVRSVADWLTNIEEE